MKRFTTTGAESLHPLLLGALVPLLTLFCSFCLFVTLILIELLRPLSSPDDALRSARQKPPPSRETPNPQKPPRSPAERESRPSSKGSRKGRKSEGDEDDPPPFPDSLTGKSERREAMKVYIRDFALFLKGREDLSLHNFPSVRNYILNCTSGEPYYEQCREIRKVRETYGWKPTTLLTICKGGGLVRPKPNYERQAKIARTKKAQAKDYVGVGLPHPDHLT